MLAACLGLAGTAAAQEMVLNGGFTNNTAGSTVFNMSNADFTNTVANCTGFGTAEELDLIYGTDFGPQPPVGNIKIGLHRQANGNSDAFSATLNGPVFPGQSYQLQFDLSALAGGAGSIEVGISNSPNTFGTLVYAADSIDGWVHHNVIIVAPVMGQYLTVREVPGGGGDGGTNFSCIAQLSLISAGPAFSRVVSLSALPREIRTGQRSVITVNLDRAAPPGGSRFTVRYSSTALTGPATFTVPAGRRWATFIVFGSNRATTARRVDITLSNPASSATTYVLVNP
ncbi:MAG TPA: hypothetical protein PLL78_00090 [Fimbriimonadaceae bacterium]|nr:hypothetical protein [Fimbriimonadaceae bacterium]HRJ95060.1 hypothetical protein [Fimbriimonadaceae bacterium]